MINVDKIRKLKETIQKAYSQIYMTTVTKIEILWKTIQELNS
jgi:hypothetical protein